jgi:hypothetical protein
MRSHVKPELEPSSEQQREQSILLLELVFEEDDSAAHSESQGSESLGEDLLGLVRLQQLERTARIEQQQHFQSGSPSKRKQQSNAT